MVGIGGMLRILFEAVLIRIANTFGNKQNTVEQLSQRKVIRIGYLVARLNLKHGSSVTV